MMRSLRIIYKCFYFDIIDLNQPIDRFHLNSMSLTEIKVRQAHCKEKTCFLSDEDGLSLKIEPSGRKSWCYRYTDPQTKKTSPHSVRALS